MDGESDRCALELSDAHVDVMGLRMLGGDHVEGPWLPSGVAGAPRTDYP
jgi:maleate cis-trans isomerase